MNKYIVSSIFITLSLSSLNAITYTNKTFMSVPTPHDYLAMKYSSGHRILKEGSTDTNPWNATLQIAPFYRTSNNKTNLGKYFGTEYSNELKIAPATETTALQSNMIIKGTTDFVSTLRLNPEHTTYGAYVSWHQKLDSTKKGLSFSLRVPIQNVSNDPKASVHNETKDTTAGTNKGMLDFLAGNVVQTTLARKQDALTNAKICGERSKSGIADLECSLGYKMVEEESCELNGALNFIVPTGTTPTGEYLFEPVLGNGKHWGLGASFDASINIIKKEIHSLECLFHIDFRYLFKNDQKRTLGYRQGLSLIEEEEDISVSLPWEYYLLGGEAGKVGTFPLANVLTRNVSVLPAGMAQGHLSLAYHRNNTTMDLGYAFFAKEGEKVTLKSRIGDEQYGIAAPSYSPNSDGAFVIPTYSLGKSIKNSELDLQTPATPAILKHSIHGAISYTLSEWKNPFMMGCGFSIDWTQDNVNPTGYMLWAKLGASF